MNKLQNTHPKETFIETYKRTGTIASGAAAAGIARRTVYTWLAQDPEFADRVKQAREDVIDSVEQAAIERAKTKSDLMAIMILKHNRPELYGDRVRVEGQIDHRVLIKFVPAPMLAESPDVSIPQIGPKKSPEQLMVSQGTQEQALNESIEPL